MFNVFDRNTFQHLHHWIEISRRQMPRESHSRFLVVGSHIPDQTHNTHNTRQVTYEEACTFAKYYGLRYVEFAVDSTHTTPQAPQTSQPAQTVFERLFEHIWKETDSDPLDNTIGIVDITKRKRNHTMQNTQNTHHKDEHNNMFSYSTFCAIV